MKSLPATPMSSHATHVAGCMQSHACSYEPLQMLLPYAQEIESLATMETRTSTVRSSVCDALADRGLTAHRPPNSEY